MDKYTTQAILNSIVEGSDEKKAEEKKLILSNDAYAVTETLMNIFNAFRENK
jgi:hypothetical protein